LSAAVSGDAKPVLSSYRLGLFIRSGTLLAILTAAEPETLR